MSETCKICGGKCSPGKALLNGLTQSNDPFGGTISRRGAEELVDCLKCEKCGKSFVPFVSEPKFTPGKYHVVKHSWADTSIEADSGATLCTSTIDYGDTDEDNQEEMEEWQSAQMALFASAPDMYRMLENCHSALSTIALYTPANIVGIAFLQREILKVLEDARGETIKK